MAGGAAIIVEWILLAAGLVLVTLPVVYLNIPWLAALSLGASFAIRAVRTRRLLPRTDLEPPWLLFILSAAWGAWISIQPGLAQAQLVRLLAAFAVFCVLVAAGYRWQNGDCLAVVRVHGAPGDLLAAQPLV